MPAATPFASDLEVLCQKLDADLEDESVVAKTLSLGETERRVKEASLSSSAVASSQSSGGSQVLRAALNRSLLPRLQVDHEEVTLLSSHGPRYASQRALGQGAMGEVDLVEDRDIGRAVARKRLLADESDLTAVARFVEEVRTIGRLEHPNIVPIHDAGMDEDGRFFFVMKYVDGETLESIIERLREGDVAYLQTYDRARRVEIFQQILRALQFAHNKGILHRDVKPANVMVGRSGEVLLMDWGIARAFGSDAAAGGPSPDQEVSLVHPDAVARPGATEHGALVGTPMYMSPEQARGQSSTLDARSDLYSAALLFHEWLGFEHTRAHCKSLLATLVEAHSAPAPLAGQLFSSYRRVGVGVEYAWVVHKGLQLDPDARYQSATEMLDDLHSIAAGTFAVRCPFTFSKRVSNMVANQLDRAPLVIMSAVVFLTLVMVLLLGYVIVDVWTSTAV